MKKPTTLPEFQSLLNELTGWGDSTPAKITMVFFKQRYHVSTDICTTGDHKVSAEGVLLEEALINLAREVQRYYDEQKGWWKERNKHARKVLKQIEGALE